MNGWNDNEHESQSTTRVPTGTKMDVLMSAKEKMLLTSKHYLKAALTKTESNSSRPQPTAHSNAPRITRSCLK